MTKIVWTHQVIRMRKHLLIMRWSVSMPIRRMKIRTRKFQARRQTIWERWRRRLNAAPNMAATMIALLTTIASNAVVIPVSTWTNRTAGHATVRVTSILIGDSSMIQRLSQQTKTWINFMVFVMNVLWIRETQRIKYIAVHAWIRQNKENNTRLRIRKCVKEEYESGCRRQMDWFITF